LATGRELRRAKYQLPFQQDTIASLAWSADGKMLACGISSSRILLWDVPQWKEKGMLIGHQGQVRALRFSKSGHMLASGSGDNTVKVWNVIEGRELATLRGHKQEVRSVLFLFDDELIVSAGDGIKAWHSGTGRHLADLGPTEPVEFLAFVHEANRLISGSGRRVTLWDVPQLENKKE